MPHKINKPSIQGSYLTILAWIQDWDSQNATQIATELCGFVTILSGTFLLHKTKDMGSSVTMEPTRLAESELQNQ